MIIINLKVTTVKGLQEKYDKFFRDSLHDPLQCPNCGGNTKKHGGYSRCLFKDKSWGQIRVKRVMCHCCSKTHALIPCFIIPYAHHSADDREQALRDYAKGATIETIAEDLRVDRRTISKWFEWFRRKQSGIVDFLSQELATSFIEAREWLWGVKTRGRSSLGWVLNLLQLYTKLHAPDFQNSTLAYLNLRHPELN